MGLVSVCTYIIVIEVAQLQKIKVRVVALVNDTVGTQVATAFEFGNCDLGVIIGNALI